MAHSSDSVLENTCQLFAKIRLECLVFYRTVKYR